MYRHVRRGCGFIEFEDRKIESNGRDNSSHFLLLSIDLAPGCCPALAVRRYCHIERRVLYSLDSRAESSNNLHRSLTSPLVFFGKFVNLVLPGSSKTHDDGDDIPPLVSEDLTHEADDDRLWDIFCASQQPHSNQRIPITRLQNKSQAQHSQKIADPRLRIRSLELAPLWGISSFLGSSCSAACGGAFGLVTLLAHPQEIGAEPKLGSLFPRLFMLAWYL